MTPRLFSVDVTGMTAPAILTFLGLSVWLEDVGVPRIMASDLLGLRQRPLRVLNFHIVSIGCGRVVVARVADVTSRVPCHVIG